MKIYIVRHGQDDDTVRGGWSDASLTSLGIEQARALRRAVQTAEIIVELPALK